MKNMCDPTAKRRLDSKIGKEWTGNLAVLG